MNSVVFLVNQPIPDTKVLQEYCVQGSSPIIRLHAGATGVEVERGLYDHSVADHLVELAERLELGLHKFLAAV